MAIAAARCSERPVWMPVIGRNAISNYRPASFDLCPVNGIITAFNNEITTPINGSTLGSNGTIGGNKPVISCDCAPARMPEGFDVTEELLLVLDCCDVYFLLLL